MKRKALVIFIVLAMVVPGAVWAQGAAADAPKPAAESAKSVSVEFSNIPVKTAISKLFESSGKSYIMMGDIGAKGVVDISLKDVTFDQALKAITDSAGLKYSFEDGIYTIADAKPAAAYQPAAVASQPVANATDSTQAASADQNALATDALATEQQRMDQMMQDWYNSQAVGLQNASGVGYIGRPPSYYDSTSNTTFVRGTIMTTGGNMSGQNQINQVNTMGGSYISPIQNPFFNHQGAPAQFNPFWR